jgi:hypothetical protein
MMTGDGQPHRREANAMSSPDAERPAAAARVATVVALTSLVAAIVVTLVGLAASWRGLILILVGQLVVASVAGALDAYRDGIERVIDLAAVNGRVFVNSAVIRVRDLA